jgi:hypothetical protein
MRKPNLMFRSIITSVAILAAGPVFAQDKPIIVYFEPCKDQQLNDAIAVALSGPGLIQALKPGPGVLIVSIPDKIDVDRGRVSGTTWSFTVAFHRDGSSLGQSAEGCNEHKLSDCTDQLVSDIKSAAGASQH